jgi:hypothetical protein
MREKNKHDKSGNASHIECKSIFDSPAPAANANAMGITIQKLD